MTIKEVEQQLGISRTTIRFYEREHLINPKRDGNTYREYSEEDVATLKKIIILRKLGFSIEEIKDFLAENVPLQELLEKNVQQLQEKVNELTGAIKICKKMQSRQENFDTFNENYYWEEIKEQEQAGSRFLEIVNDSIGYEKEMFCKYFELLDENGNLRYSMDGMLRRVIKVFLVAGVISFLFSGLFAGEWGINYFIRGLTYPICFLVIGTVFGLPWHFVKKKYPKMSTIVKKVIYGLIMGVPVVVSFIIIIFAILNRL